MIKALERLAEMEEQGLLTFDVKFKPSRYYLTAEGYLLGTTRWYVRLDVNDWLPILAADTLEEAAEKALHEAERELVEQGLAEPGERKAPKPPAR